MSTDGLPESYTKPYAGGYTLEAELGISPNGYADPDYLGWEIKQYRVKDFVDYRLKNPVTLMTPEPTNGFYKSSGVGAFLKKYSYPDKSGKPDRINFGGIHANSRSFNTSTGLKLILQGYDKHTRKITDFNGQIALVDQSLNVAACWNCKHVFAHWTCKHSDAAYIPYLMQKPPPQYKFGARTDCG